MSSEECREQTNQTLNLQLKWLDLDLKAQKFFSSQPVAKGPIIAPLFLYRIIGTQGWK